MKAKAKYLQDNLQDDFLRCRKKTIKRPKVNVGVINRLLVFPFGYYSQDRKQF